MCGITGILTPGGSTSDAMERSIRAMNATLTHRGPDDTGIWCSLEQGIALGHNRLSILDLSSLGHQPMQSACGRFHICYNGEIYNHRELRCQLKDMGVQFKGESDTETLVNAISQWGVKETVSRCIGMFAFALWDKAERELWLIRDRLGIKPLYYGLINDSIVFGSELKALTAHPSFDRTLNRGALSLYFRHGYIPAPYSIFENTYKLLPGSILRLKSRNWRGSSLPSPTRYWSAREAWLQGESSPYIAEADEVVDCLEALLSDAVNLRMISDVPLGAFLSGGIDSSTVVALMQSLSKQPIKTFSIGFEDKAFDEAKYATSVANHLGTDHTNLYASAETMRDVIPELPVLWDEPFADSSQIPTYCVSKLTKEHVTVSLSGDGGDELFAGYTRYDWTNTWKLLKHIPLPVRRAAAQMQNLPISLFNLLGSWGPKIHWRLEALAQSQFNDYYRYFISTFKEPSSFVLRGNEPATPLTSPEFSCCRDTTHQMTLWDTSMYLPDDILTKVDRASMAVSLEARVPLLDHRIVEFAAKLPTSIKVRNGQRKWILRQLLDKYVPRHLTDRPKRGFAIPLYQWLNADLRDWCEPLLDTKRIQDEGYIDHRKVDEMWSRFKKGETIWCHQIWQVLVFQEWLAKWK